eukprot:CAMPEP_0184297306 /NCGR_PEP_ID=MMETSP1049-20130417/8234_1 /TAXON_ID=77928 /ORGANISM="Proteomonas sulcata, Strain CCMP704" /LENGTH=162 /DNA_ID=CAMNT_0026606975 /DNA_START=24 /DNA_END=512 /DNA_ORIENTATION=+
MPFLFTKLEISEVIVGEDYTAGFLDEEILPDMQVAFLALISISSISSIISILSALSLYVHLNTVMPDARSKLWLIREQAVGFPEIAFIVGVVALLLAAPMGVLITFGGRAMITMCVVLGIGLIVYLVFLGRLIHSSTKHIRPKLKLLGEELQGRLDALPIKA